MNILAVVEGFNHTLVAAQMGNNAQFHLGIVGSQQHKMEKIN